MNRLKNPSISIKIKIQKLESQNGVLLKDVEAVRKELLSLITLMWQVVQKESALLTARGKLLSTVVRDYDVGTRKPSKVNYITFLTQLNTLVKNVTNRLRILRDLKLFGILATRPSLKSSERSFINGLSWDYQRDLGIVLKGFTSNETNEDVDQVIGMVGAYLPTPKPPKDHTNPALPTQNEYEALAKDSEEGDLTGSWD